MPTLALTLCGSVAISGDGVSPSSLGAKSLALLAYLALEPGVHSRDKLTALLWGEYPDEKAKASLRQALTHLREAAPGVIRIDRTSVTLAVPIDCDVTTFLHLARESPRLAADCEVSGFLDGLHIRRSPAFGEWADGICANLVRRLSGVLASVTAEAVAMRQWREGVRYAERWVAVAPLDGAANAALVEARFMSGDRALALHAFDEYRGRLAEETGQLPEPGVLELVERIRSAGPAAARRHATEEWYAAAPSFQGSLIGRGQEWDALTRAWRKAADGRAQIAIIEGDSGVGKSRLSEDFTRWVSASGGTVLHGRAYDSRGSAPFAPVIEALRSGIDAPGLAGTDPQWLVEVARVVPEIRERFRSLDPASTATTADGWRLFEGIAQMLAALADESPIVVFIDDVHWCDADSCSLLHSLIRRLDAAPVLWCLTFSPGSVERDAAAARLVRALRTFRQAQALVLRPLNETEVWQLLRALGRVTAPDGARRLAARIHEVTAGFPFYVIELLKTLFAQEWLTVDPETGEWIVSAQAAGDAAAIVLAPTVHEAIAERIECLPNDPGDVLISLAASARGCRTDVLSHVHGISRLRAAAAGDALVERHLAIEEDGVYRCAHPVIARVVSDALGPSRRREVHRGLALALQVTIPPGGDAPDPGEIARHAEQGGERATAYRYAMFAAEGCEGRFAHEEALTWLDLAASVAAGPDEADVVNRTTARLLDSAGSRTDRSTTRDGIRAGRFAVTDFDLPARV